MFSPRRTPNVTAPVQAVASLLNKQPADLAGCTDATIKELCAAANLDVVARAEVEMYISGVRNAKSSASATSPNVPSSKLYSWKESESRAQRFEARYNADFNAARADSKDPFDPLRRVFENNAAAKLISPESSLVLSYLLFANVDEQYGRYLLACLLLHTPPDERLSVHNWLLAGQMDSATRHSLGGPIERLKLPLYPPAARGADTLNAKLLRSGTDPVGAGGPEYLFSRDTLLPAVSPAEGAGWIATQTAPDGSTGVDTTPLDVAIRAALDGIRAELQDVRQSLHPRPQRQQQAPPYVPQLQQQQQQQPYVSRRQQHQDPAMSYMPAAQRQQQQPRQQYSGRQQQQPQQFRQQRPNANGGDSDTKDFLSSLFPSAPAPEGQPPGVTDQGNTQPHKGRDRRQGN